MAEAPQQPEQEELLPMVGGLNVYEAYKYSLDKIYDFLYEVTSSPASFGVHDVKRQSILKDVRLQILRLSVPTSKFKDNKDYCIGYPKDFDFGPPDALPAVRTPAPKKEPKTKPNPKEIKPETEPKTRSPSSGQSSGQTSRQTSRQESPASSSQQPGQQISGSSGQSSHQRPQKVNRSRSGLETWKRSPVQHILRIYNPEYLDLRERVEQNEKISKFTVSGHPHSPKSILNNENTKDQLEFWSPHDLLGLFLSLMGPAPAGANKRNYFLPLTAVYGRWCAKIAGRGARGFEPTSGRIVQGVSDPPTVFQCTWEGNEKRLDQRFFLGASLAGYNWNLNETGQWENTLKMGRYNVLKERASLEPEYSFERSPNRIKLIPPEKPGGPVEYGIDPTGTRFGNCGETYPFVVMLSAIRRSYQDSDIGNEPENSNIHGLALPKMYLTADDDPKQSEEVKEANRVYKSGVWKYIWGPCGNCKVLLSRFGCARSESNFYTEAGMSENPLPPIKSTSES